MQKTYPENATVLFRWECTAYPQLIVIDAGPAACDTLTDFEVAPE